MPSASGVLLQYLSGSKSRVLHGIGNALFPISLRLIRSNAPPPLSLSLCVLVSLSLLPFSLPSVPPCLKSPSAPRVALYKCESCGAEEYVMNDRGRVEEPSVCQSCHKRWGQRLIHNRSAFFDKQIIKLQVNPASFAALCQTSFWLLRKASSGGRYSL
jgi:hypothetical protein